MMNSETFLECYGGCSLAVIACMNTVGQAIASEGDFLGGFVYFEAFYHHNMICADYATRFGDDDLVHKLLVSSSVWAYSACWCRRGRLMDRTLGFLRSAAP